MPNRGFETRARALVTFGPFSIDAEAPAIHKHGVRLKVAPQALRVLLCLTKQAPNLVSREMLFQTLWPGDTHVDFEGNLNAIIRDLRELLGDSARNPRYIETEPRRGYRFIAPVTTLEPESKPEPAIARESAGAPERSTVEQSRDKPPRWIFDVAAIAVIAALAGIPLWRSRFGRAASEEPLRMVALTNVAGRAGHATFSPDASKIAFHWDGDPQTGFDIYVGKIGSEHFEHLTHDRADDLYPAWSPDGRDIAFLRRFPDGRCAIYLAAVDGSGERLVQQVPAETSVSWSPDGQWLAYSVQFFNASEASSPDFGVYAVSLVSKQVKQLTRRGPGWLGDLDGSFSPDGKRIAFFRASSVGLNWLFVQNLDSAMNPIGAPRQVTAQPQNARSPVWTPDGAAILYSSQGNGGRSLWQVSAAGSAKPKYVGGEDASEPAIDRQGRIVYERIAVHDNLESLPLCGDGGPCPGAEPKRLLYQRMLARNPSWSPGGERVAFESTDNGRVQVWIANRDGSGAFQLSAFHSPNNGTPRWSPDGRSIVADSRDSGHSKIYLFDVETRAIKQITTGDWEDVTPSFSRDGKSVYFASTRGGQFEVWKLDLASGAATQITHHGGFYSQESFDGKMLYYAKGMKNTQIGAVPVNGGTEATVVNSLDYWIDFAVGPAGIYFMPASNKPGNLEIELLRPSDGRQTRLAVLPGIAAQGISVSQNGRDLLLSIRSSIETNLIALERPNH